MLLQGRTVMDVLGRKRAAVEFLHLALTGQVEEAFRRHVEPRGRHHHTGLAAGFESLKAGMKESHAKHPRKQLEVRHVIGDDDLVAVHSRITVDAGQAVAAVHVFRFDGDRIVEMWDLAQPVPKDSPNKDGAF